MQEELNSIESIRNILNNPYGLTNRDELWAVAIENFFKLSTENKTNIIKLINHT